MLCNEEIPDDFYIQKAFEYTQTEGKKSDEGMRLFMGADKEKWDELKKLEAVKNLLNFNGKEE